MRKRKLVDSPSRVQQNCQTSVLYWQIANQLPTRQASYRHFGFVSLLYETYSISAALYCQVTPVEADQPHTVTYQSF